MSGQFELEDEIDIEEKPQTYQVVTFEEDFERPVEENTTDWLAILDALLEKP